MSYWVLNKQLVQKIGNYNTHVSTQPTHPVAVLIAIVLATAFSTALYYSVRPFWAREPSEDTKKMADIVAMRLGVVYAVVIGMMFANVRLEHFQMIDAIESEASAVTRLYKEIERQGGEESQTVRNSLIEYIRLIVDEQWPALREGRVLAGDRAVAGGRVELKPVWDYVIKTERKTGDQNFRRLIDQS